jgi:hypothetical protein
VVVRTILCITQKVVQAVHKGGLWKSTHKQQVAWGRFMARSWKVDETTSMGVREHVESLMPPCSGTEMCAASAILLVLQITRMPKKLPHNLNQGCARAREHVYVMHEARCGCTKCPMLARIRRDAG